MIPSPNLSENADGNPTCCCELKSVSRFSGSRPSIWLYALQYHANFQEILVHNKTRCHHELIEIHCGRLDIFRWSISRTLALWSIFHPVPNSEWCMCPLTLIETYPSSGSLQYISCCQMWYRPVHIHQGKCRNRDSTAFLISPTTWKHCLVDRVTLHRSAMTIGISCKGSGILFYLPRQDAVDISESDFVWKQKPSPLHVHNT